MGFPIQLKGTSYDKQDFEGSAYVNGIPTLATDFVSKIGTCGPYAARGRMAANYGRKFCYTERYAPIFPGMRIMAYESSIGMRMYGRVLEYTASTGYLCFSCLAVRNIFGLFPAQFAVSTWFLRLCGAIQETQNAPLPIASNGTGASDIHSARKAMAQMAPASAYTVFEDFMGSAFDNTVAGNSLMYPWGFVGLVSQVISNTVATQDRQGVVQLNANSVTTNSALYYSQGSSQALIGGFIGCGNTRSWFNEWLVQLPTLSNVTNRYTLQVGIAGPITPGGFTLGNQMAYFSYTDSVNTGQWQYVTEGSSFVLTANNSASAVVAATWYKLRMTYTPAGGIVFSVNGVNIGTVNTANLLPGMGFCVPFLRITRNLGAGGNVFADYMQHYGT